MIYSTKHTTPPPVFRIYITGNDPIEVQDLKTELSLRFRKKIHISVFEKENECLNSINPTTDIVFFVGSIPMDDDYSEEIKMRRKVRLKSPMADVFVLYNEVEKTEAIHFLYDLTQLNPFWGMCRLEWKHWITTPVNNVVGLFKRRSTVKPNITSEVSYI